MVRVHPRRRQPRSWLGDQKLGPGYMQKLHESKSDADKTPEKNMEHVVKKMSECPKCGSRLKTLIVKPEGMGDYSIEKTLTLCADEWNSCGILVKAVEEIVWVGKKNEMQMRGGSATTHALPTSQ